MPDFMDHVQDQVQRNLDDALAVATRRATGLAECEECGAEISALRQGLGARLCVAHQQLRESSQGRGGRR
jgi:RNA polymerase-binding transcription factor DksA